jgi:hypothetical protein
MNDKLELLARSGYAARGAVYMVLGYIALTSVFWGGGGGQASSEGALATILRQPFGRILLGLVAIGLIGHVLWRLAEALLNADHHDDDAKGYAARAGNFASAVANGFLVFVAVRLALGWGSSGGGQGGGGRDGMAFWLLQQPFGRWMLGLVGLVVIGVGLVQVWRGVAAQYQKRVQLPADHEHKLHLVCAFGLSARGVLLAITGGFLVYGAITISGQQAGGTAEALDWVHQLPFGRFLYGLAALGLIAFGIYSFVEARYRTMAVPRVAKVKSAAANLVS